MSLLVYLTWLIALLTVIGGYKFATRFHRDDPLFGLVFGLVLGIGVLVALPVLLPGLGLFVLLLPIAYTARRYRQANTVTAPQGGRAISDGLRTQLTAWWDQLQTGAQRGVATLRELVQTRTERGRPPEQQEATSQSPVEGRLVACVRCNASVVIADPVSECPECGFVLTIPEAPNR